MSASQLRPAAAGVQSVVRAAALLRAVAAATGPDGTATALGEAVGLNRTTSWRLLTTLEQEDLVRRDEARGTYVLGPALLALADQASGTALAEKSREVLRDLAAQAQETAALAVVRDGTLTYVAEAPAGGVVAAGWLGQEVSLHATSTGKVLLAFSPDEERRALLGLPPDQPLPRHTPTTITSYAALEDELAQVRAHGYAVCRGEFESSAWGVSAPVLDLVGRPVAVVSLWGPGERLTPDRFESLGRLALSGAAEVARRRAGAHHEATGNPGGAPAVPASPGGPTR
ncbi:IclR family transcriptional regulator [Nocardioides sp. HDW12B]|uniref:IclR family transcriptional regulator n=1 Tax=Nocardioides sp. HDW12B TaxID=2714939 RepID=UPI00140A4630|nr:IclR family transcriptional regulator [Nocardioides sp. HDW12B]QIK65978.1 IclR family transcriptional regulator [Nocardioides sp. HDW12B]